MKPMSSMRSASSRTRHLDAGEVDSARCRRQIEQPARRGDEDVDAAAQRADLRPIGRRRRRRRRRRSQVPAVGAEALGDLHRELARRGEDQGADGLAARRAWCGAGAAGSAARTRRSCRCRSARCRARRGREHGGMAWAWIGVGVEVLFFRKCTRDSVVQLKVVKLGSKNRLSIMCVRQPSCETPRPTWRENKTPRAIWAVDER